MEDVLQPSRIMTGVLAQKHDIYLYDMGEPNEFQEILQVLRDAQLDDYITIHINSYGGQANTAIQLRSHIRNCKATVVASLEGACASAATIVALSCNAWEINPDIEFMVHNYSMGMEGKGNELQSAMDFKKKWADSLLRSTYQHFLTTKEIDEVIAGKDFWFTADEVKTRLEKVVKARSKDASGIAL